MMKTDFTATTAFGSLVPTGINALWRLHAL